MGWRWESPTALKCRWRGQDFKGSLAPLDQLRIKQDIVGIKVKLAGDAVYEQDSWLPQIAVGAMYKKNKGIEGLGALGVTNVTQLGAKADHGYDYYVAATKIVFEYSLLLNATVRATRANQMGLLGFGGDQGSRTKLMPELSAAYLVTRKLAVGAEYRQQAAQPRSRSRDGVLRWVCGLVPDQERVADGGVCAAGGDHGVQSEEAARGVSVAAGGLLTAPQPGV